MADSFINIVGSPSLSVKKTRRLQSQIKLLAVFHISTVAEVSAAGSQGERTQQSEVTSRFSELRTRDDSSYVKTGFLHTLHIFKGGFSCSALECSFPVSQCVRLKGAAIPS